MVAVPPAAVSGTSACRESRYGVPARPAAGLAYQLAFAGAEAGGRH